MVGKPRTLSATACPPCRQHLVSRGMLGANTALLIPTGLDRRALASREPGTGSEPHTASPHSALPLLSQQTAPEPCCVHTPPRSLLPAGNNTYGKETSEMSRGAAPGGCLLLWLETTHFADRNSACLLLLSAGNTLLITGCWRLGAAISTGPPARGQEGWLKHSGNICLLC